MSSQGTPGGHDDLRRVAEEKLAGLRDRISASDYEALLAVVLSELMADMESENGQ